MSLFKPFYYDGLKHLYKLVFDDNYRNYSFLESKLLTKKRYTHCKFKINNINIEIPDTLSFLSAYKEIFIQRIYDFKCSKNSPNILDLGANVGLSVLFLNKFIQNQKLLLLKLIQIYSLI